MAPRIRAPRTVGTITYTGPFFERDPAKTFAENVTEMMVAIAAEGEADYVARIASIPPRGVDTGATRSKVRGRVVSHARRKWRATAVIGIPNVGMTGPEAIHTYAALARIERQYHVARSTANALRRAGAINHAELTRGLG